MQINANALSALEASAFRQDRFAAHVGIELLEAAPGRASARLEIGEHHLNAIGLVHGAAIFSLADLVFAVASNAHGLPTPSRASAAPASFPARR